MHVHPLVPVGDTNSVFFIAVFCFVILIIVSLNIYVYIIIVVWLKYIYGPIWTMCPRCRTSRSQVSLIWIQLGHSIYAFRLARQELCNGEVQISFGSTSQDWPDWWRAKVWSCHLDRQMCMSTVPIFLRVVSLIIFWITFEFLIQI
jgi:hypothetical protein